MLGLKKGKERLFLQIPDLKKSCNLLDTAGKEVLSNMLPEHEKKKNLIRQRECHLPFSSSESDYKIDVAIANVRKNGNQVYLKPDHNHEKLQEVVHLK